MQERTHICECVCVWDARARASVFLKKEDPRREKDVVEEKEEEEVEEEEKEERERP